jgi:hypothetical protein
LDFDRANPVLLRPPQFFVIFVCEVELSQQSGSHFADLIFQKCHAPTARSKFLIKQIGNPGSHITRKNKDFAILRVKTHP